MEIPGDNNDLEEKIESEINELGYKLVKFRKVFGKTKIRINITIYSIDGISHKDCIRVSNRLTPFLNHSIDKDYLLSVSSPGIGRLLKTDRELDIFQDSSVKIKMEEENGSKNIVSTEGILVSYTDDLIKLQINDEIKEIDRKLIKKILLNN